MTHADNIAALNAQPTQSPTNIANNPEFVRRSDGLFVAAGHSPLTVEEEKEARFRNPKHPLPTESRASRGLRFVATGC